jgi:hypothetical protein
MRDVSDRGRLARDDGLTRLGPLWPPDDEFDRELDRTLDWIAKRRPWWMWICPWWYALEMETVAAIGLSAQRLGRERHG